MQNGKCDFPPERTFIYSYRLYIFIEKYIYIYSQNLDKINKFKRKTVKSSITLGNCNKAFND